MYTLFCKFANLVDFGVLNHWILRYGHLKLVMLAAIHRHTHREIVQKLSAPESLVFYSIGNEVSGAL